MKMDDFDKAIEDILLSEDLCAKEAYVDGVKTGFELGMKEGYPHGYRKGSQIAAEIFAYKGFALAWLARIKYNSNQDDDPESPSRSERQTQALEKLIILVDEYPRQNIEDDLDRKLSELRNKFKQVCSILRVSPRDLLSAPVLPGESF